MRGDSLEGQVRALLHALDPEPDREGLVRTPERVARALAFLTRGYEEDPRRVINGALFTEDYSEMIVLKDIDFYSLCEHHILPFFGKAHVAYLPDRHIVGLSKLARLVEVFARRLQVQERMTSQIANTTSISCSTRTIVRSRGKPLIKVISLSRSSGEVPAAGSSINRIFGLAHSAIATSSWRFWP